MDIIFTARHTDVREPFREVAAAKLTKLERLDDKASRVDVEVTEEHNPRLSHQRERVELTLSTRGPKIRAEAAAEDRVAAFDLALGKLESRLRRACDRRKDRRTAPVRLGDLAPSDLASDAELPAIRLGRGGGMLAGGGTGPAMKSVADAADAADEADSEDAATAETAAAVGAEAGPGAQVAAGTDLDPDSGSDVRIDMQGDGPLVVREKFHAAVPMSIEQALFEMELVGHDFFLFTDSACGLPSVVYRRRGYRYGVIRLVDERAAGRNGEFRPEQGRDRQPGGAPASGRAPGSR